MNNIPDRTIVQKSIGRREVQGITRALDDYKRDVLKLQKLPMTADCLIENLELEKTFRRVLVEDLRSLIETNCANCPLGNTRNTCETECPFKTIDNIIGERLKELKNLIPGGEL